MALHLPFGQNTSLGQRFFVAPQVDGGVLAIDGTGAIAFAGPSLDAIALETFTGTGTETFTGPALTGTALETFTGTGATDFGGLALVASGVETFSGTGTVTWAGLVLASTGVETFTSAGAIAFGGPSLSGTGGVGAAGVTGTGNVTWVVPALTASCLETFTGTGVTTFAGPNLQGGAVPDVTGTGTIAFQSPTLTGLATGGDESQIGGGRRYVYPPSQPAQEFIGGIGAIRMQAAALSGTGALAITGSGTTRSRAAYVGVGGQVFGGRGALVAPVILRGAGAVLIRRLESSTASSPARSIQGVGTITTRAFGTAEATVTPPPDAIDRAWVDLQTEELLLLKVLP